MNFKPLLPHGPAAAESAIAALEAIGVSRLRMVVEWLRSLQGPQDPQRLADEIEALERVGTHTDETPEDERA